MLHDRFEKLASHAVYVVQTKSKAQKDCRMAPKGKDLVKKGLWRYIRRDSARSGKDPDNRHGVDETAIVSIGD